MDIELKKVNIFMGPQSCGKSTLAKIICFCTWMEKTNVYSHFVCWYKYDRVARVVPVTPHGTNDTAFHDRP